MAFPGAPRQLAPPDGAVFTSTPRQLTLEWQPVSDPSGVSYRVYLELGYINSARWDLIPQSSGYYGTCAGAIAATSCTTSDFPGTQPGSWYVLAVNGNNQESAPSSRRTFVFATPDRAGRTFDFTLPAGSQASVIVGPVAAGNGPLDVTLGFADEFIILACVGTSSGCRPMGGHPMTTRFNIPGDFPVGQIQARVYFNPNFVQPAGDARGTVTFVYNPL